MSASVVISPKLVLPNLVADTPESAIRQLGALLVDEGYTDESYTEAVLTREAAYPTGIEFPAYGVALPHGEHDAVCRAAIAFGICSKPVRWRQMDDFSQEIEVDVVALIGITDPEEHLDVLGKLIRAFSDEALAKRLVALGDAAYIAELLCDVVGGE